MKYLPFLLLGLWACDDASANDPVDAARQPVDATVANAAPMDAESPDVGADAAPPDVGCTDCPQYSPPEPWARPIEDYLEAGDAQDYESFLRAVHDLAVYEDRLLLVYGDATQNLGRVTDIDIRYFDDPEVAEAQVAHTSREEHLDGFRWIDDSLVLPGIDAVDDAWLGNVYVRRPGEPWVMQRTVQNGVHVHDVAWWIGSMWAVGSGGTQEEWGLNNIYAHLWRSRDWGENWAIEKREHNRRAGDIRWTRMLAAGDLYLFGYRTDAQGAINELLQFRYDATVLWPLEGVLSTVFVERTQPLGDDTGLVVGLDTAGEGVQGVWRLADQLATPITHFDGRALVDLVRDGEKWLILTHRDDTWAMTPDPWQAEVWETTDFESFQLVLDWTSEVPLTSLAAWRGDLFFGDVTGGVLRASD